MAVADPKSPTTAVRVEKGDTLSAIAKANGLTLSEIKALNPALTSDPKYNGGSTIFSNTKINIAPPAPKADAGSISSGFVTDSQNTARLAAEQAARDAAAKAQADAAAKAAADAKAATDAKAAADAAAKTAADKAAADAAAKAAADKAAADKAAADALLAGARTEAERQAALRAIAEAEAARLRAQAEADAAARAAAASGTGNINTSTTLKTPTAAETAVAVAKATELSVADKQRLDAIEVMKARFKQYGLETLVEKIRQLAVEGATESTITLQLQETPEYQTRFKANTARLKNNLTVLAPAEYLAVEDSYRQTLRAYGLKQFDTDEYVSQFIANDVSPTELSNRVQLAVQRVQNADPAISKTLRDYYGIGQADLVAYTLDPATQFKKIERQVQAAEIGTAARIQGLETGVTVAEQLAAQGVTQAEAQKGYATIADILPTAEKLSAIYGSTLEGYNQSSAEQEVFNTLASAQRARQKLTAREVAQFGGTAGLAKTALSTGGGQI
jgi:LysM repeat protein